MFLQWYYQGCSAEGPGSEDPKYPKVDPCRRLREKLFGGFFHAVEKFTFLGARLALPVRQTTISSLLR